MMFIRRTLPVIIAFVIGVTAIALYYVPHQTAQDILETHLGPGSGPSYRP